MISAVKKKLTYADYAQLEEGAPYQLIDGELVTSPSPTVKHQEVLLEFATRLRSHVRRRDVGKVLVSPIDVYLSEHNTFQPDIVFISKGRMDIVASDKIEGAPDLVVEVLSPGTAHLDVKTKKEAYARFGVKEYWIVDPMRRTVAIFENREGEYHTVRAEDGKDPAKSKIVSGFEVAVEVLFEALD